jgi:hypothetical protein
MQEGEPSSDYGVTLKLLRVKLPEPSEVPTPFSKKEPPPKERATTVAFLAAALNASTLALLGWPFQSLHAVSVGSTRAVKVPLVFAASNALPGDTSAHQ